MSEVTEQQLEDMEALFVQTAAGMTSDRGTITLRGLSPSTLYFADRPHTLAPVASAARPAHGPGTLFRVRCVRLAV